jgi:acetyl esterase
MQLTSSISQIINHLEKIQSFNAQDPLDDTRKYLETMTLQLSAKKEPVSMIEELEVPQENHQIPIRIYRPKGKRSQKSSAIIYIHGGWFIAGSFETHDAVVRKLANATGSDIIFIDYRLAPEHPFPAGLEDCKAVTTWLVSNAEALGIDIECLGIVGDSAGGALAAAFSTELGNLLKFQVLIYPAADNSLHTASWETYQNGPILNKEGGIQAWNWYLPNKEQQTDPLAVPILIKDFKNTPPTLVLLAEHDPLRDEGEQLSQHMNDSGVAVTTSVYKDMVHGFMHMGAILSETQTAIDEIAAFTHKTLEK